VFDGDEGDWECEGLLREDLRCKIVMFINIGYRLRKEHYIVRPSSADLIAKHSTHL
jgi:hypothetical protein